VTFDKRAEQIIGQMLSHVPDGSDGVWPHEGVRALLDREAYEDLRLGFIIQIHNNRGVHSATGGAEERALAARYRAHMDTLMLDWPRLAGALNSVAEDYERQAQRESVESRLRREI